MGDTVKATSLSDKILNRLFGSGESSYFSLDGDSSSSTDNSDFIMADPVSENWHLIEEKLKEYTVVNEHFGVSLSSIGRAVYNLSRARSSLENGAFPVDSREWADCKRCATEIDQWLPQQLKDLINLDQNAMNLFETLKYMFDQQMSKLFVVLNEWKAAQRLALLGGPSDRIVPMLNMLAEAYARTEVLLESFYQQISQFSIYVRDMAKWCSACPTALELHKERTNSCVQMQNSIRQRLHGLVQKSFVVFEQPPSIVRRSAAPDISKTQRNSKVPFDLELRVLAGETYGFRGASVEVEVLLITEKQAQDIARKTLDPLQETISTPGLLAAPRVILQAPSNATAAASSSDPAVGQMTAVFRLVRVQSMYKRTEEDSDDLYHVLFRTKSLHNGADNASQSRFWVISLPFAVLSNAHRQDKYTRARMFWQMSFKINDETSLATVVHSGKDGNEIKWQEFFLALDLWFRHATRCKEGLQIHWQYIAERLGIAVNNPAALVSWDAFYKRKTAELSFWDWFCPIADCVSKMPAYWDSGLIFGFASRETVEQLLLQTPVSSMIIRFSATNPGKIVVSYVSWNQQAPSIEHVIFDEKDNKALDGKSLAECILLSHNLQAIQFILPSNRPISELFALDSLNTQQTSECQQKPTCGYVKPKVALIWNKEPPALPDCLLNTTFDGSFDSSPYMYRSASECLSDMELQQAGENLHDYLLNDNASTPQATSNGMWSNGMN